MNIILIRHGETQDNIDKIYGQDGTSLSKTGREQIEKTKKKLEDFTYERVYYSPLTRAKQTLDILGLVGQEETLLREYNFGIFSGYSYGEILERYPIESRKWMEDPLEYKIPKGDRISDLYSRLAKYLESLIEKDRDVVLVSHSIIIQLALAWVFDDYTYLYRFRVDNGSINIISVSDGYKYISRLNC